MVDDSWKYLCMKVGRYNSKWLYCSTVRHSEFCSAESALQITIYGISIANGKTRLKIDIPLMIMGSSMGSSIGSQPQKTQKSPEFCNLLYLVENLMLIVWVKTHSKFSQKMMTL